MHKCTAQKIKFAISTVNRPKSHSQNIKTTKLNRNTKTLQDCIPLAIDFLLLFFEKVCFKILRGDL